MPAGDVEEDPWPGNAVGSSVDRLRPDSPPVAVLEQVLAGLRGLDSGRGQQPEAQQPAGVLRGDVPRESVGVVAP
ncbi:hypothetical protein RIF23_05980 [Lipingzhangella sp. LS1_29]|uniref:Uncharacterized protein n=1 Tax=Lipingzhangella rawalii TaxID=2055835 RepID=A0ABU2H3G4_9ACTN|nr:hypothetical protein [Lipingzhangella rawalii]MDS1269841.1 hypothetical protein [Lipingzhangella rawalii]